jgi:carbohydrate-selective porin OprB
MRTTLHARVLAILVLGTGAGTAFAADLGGPPAPAPTPTPTSGAYSLNVLYTGEVWDNTYGGLRQGTSYMNNIDGAFSVDTGKAFGWTGGTFFAEAFYANGISTENGWVGAVNVQSPIDTGADVPMYRIYQLYYDQDFGKTDVRFGIYDLSTESR